MTTSDAEPLPTESCGKLQLGKTGPAHAVEVTPTIMKIALKKTAYAILNLCTWLQKPQRRRRGQQRRTGRKPTITTLNKTTHEGNTAMKEENFVNAQQKYATDLINRHVGRGDNVQSVVCWYGYTQADDTMEPPSHIPEHFITRIGAELGNRMRGDKDRGLKIGNNKERPPLAVQASKLMKIYRQNTIRYP